MIRAETLLFLLATVLAVSIGGCSLVVDFDRSQLVDASVDAGQDGAVDTAENAAVDAAVDAN
jgi:hypothetical protein